jgi:hypothetical protein
MADVEAIHALRAFCSAPILNESRDVSGTDVFQAYPTLQQCGLPSYAHDIQ